MNSVGAWTPVRTAQASRTKLNIGSDLLGARCGDDELPAVPPAATEPDQRRRRAARRARRERRQAVGEPAEARSSRLADERMCGHGPAGGEAGRSAGAGAGPSAGRAPAGDGEA